MTLNQYENWVQKARSGESITYYDKGYLARQRFYDNNLRDIANFFMRLAENNVVELYQKRLTHGNINHDPKFQYIARKI
jgi:NADPH-dependent 7-cyano-7-deazaguanine reductase QueF